MIGRGAYHEDKNENDDKKNNIGFARYNNDIWLSTDRGAFGT